MDEAFKSAVNGLKDTAPVQYVLAAAVVADVLEVYPVKATFEKLSKIIERHGVLQASLTNLEDSEGGWVQDFSIQYDNAVNLHCPSF